MNNQRTINIFLFAVTIVTLAIAWIGNTHYIVPILKYAAVLTALIFGVMGGIYAISRYGLGEAKSLTLVLLTAGIGCFLIGEGIWVYYEYLQRIDPFPSIADIFYLSAYPLFFAALYREIRMTRVHLHSLGTSLSFLMGIISMLLLTVVLYFGVYMAYSPDMPLWANIIAISYGLADVALIIGTVALLVLVWEFRGGALATVWLMLFWSFFAALIADILFAMFLDSYGDYTSLIRRLCDSLWTLSYLLFAHALFSFGISIEEAKEALQSLRNSKKP